MGAAIGEEVRVGSIVWVRRKNGIWWPGRVMGPSDMSLSTHQISVTATRAKIKLLGRDNASVDWYNLESSRRIKAFRCGEFDDCIRKAESSKALASTKNLKYACRENAILHALELERLVVRRKLKRPGSETQQETCSRAKRSKHIYFSLESRDCLEHSVQSHSSKGSPNPFHAAAENTSKPMKSDSSETADEVQMRNSKAPSDFYVKQHTKMNGKRQGAISYSSESSVADKMVGPGIPKKCKLSIQQVSRRPMAPDDDSCILDYKGVAIPPNAVPAPHQSFGGSYLGEKNGYHFASVFTSNTKGTLIDVHIKVLASYRGEHVPLVSMMSRLNGKAIVGHPLNVEVLEGTAETRVPKKNLGEKLFHSNMSGTYQLIWKTSKRTPVIYSPPFSSTCEDKKISQACESFGGLTCSARKSDFSKKEEFPGKSLKKQKISNGSRKIFHANRVRGVGDADDLHTTMHNAMKDGKSKGEAVLPSVACLPVKHIFSKLLAAISKA